MSNTDPDLKPTEKNRPTAIDVVDGNLVVKRHSGKVESFPFNGFRANAPNTSITWQHTLPSGQGDTALQITDSVYVTEQDDTVTTFALDDLVPSGTDVGDLVIQYGNPPTFYGAHSIFFGKAGLYVVTYQFGDDAATGEVEVSLQISGWISNGITHTYDAADPNGNLVAQGNLVVPVMNRDVVTGRPDNLTSGMSFQPGGRHNAGVDASIYCNMYIARII
jgi:hypothetical protein